MIKINSRHAGEDREQGSLLQRLFCAQGSLLQMDWNPVGACHAGEDREQGSLLQRLFCAQGSLLAYFVLLACLVLAACSSTQTPELPAQDVPQAWVGPLETEAEVWPELDWWQQFQDQELNSIIRQVRENNLDLDNNRRNLASAQLALEEAGFNLLPTPAVTVGTGAAYTSNLSSGNSSNPNTPVDLRAGLVYNNILSKPAAYERALADYELRRAQVANLALNTLGTAASTYFQILLIRDQIMAARQNVENAEAIGRITQARVNAGVAVPIDALQQQIAIQQQRINLQSLQQNDLSARASLALLLGRSVQDFDIESQTLENINVPVTQPGLPSELLRRRPDLVQAEASLRSASANVELTRLDFFPQISLTGSASASSTSLTELLSSPETIININASLLQTLLDNGQRSRNLEQSRLGMENSLNAYRSAVINAFNDIEVQLSNIQLLEQQETLSFENLRAAEEAFRIAEVRYAEGVADFQTVLISQNTLFSSRTSYLNNKIQRLNAIVGFYQALGGGWDADDVLTMSIVGAGE